MGFEDEKDQILDQCHIQPVPQPIQLKIGSNAINNSSKSVPLSIHFENGKQTDHNNSDLNVKVDIINDLLILHDAKFVSMSKQIDDMQNEIFELKNKLMNNQDYKMDEPVPVYQISPMNSPTQQTMISFDDEDEQKQSILHTNDKVVVVESNMNRNEVKEWLSTKCLLPQYYDLFIENGIEDLSVIQLLAESDILDLGINKLGHKLKIVHEIKKLKELQVQKRNKSRNQSVVII